MKLFPQPIIEKLAENGRANAEAMADDGDTHDFFPVVKLFMPDGAGTWLLTEIDPDEPDIAFGLCDLGFGCPELGSVRISELEAARGFGMSDKSTLPDMTAGGKARRFEWSNMAQSAVAGYRLRPRHRGQKQPHNRRKGQTSTPITPRTGSTLHAVLQSSHRCQSGVNNIKHLRD